MNLNHLIVLFIYFPVLPGEKIQGDVQNFANPLTWHRQGRFFQSLVQRNGEGQGPRRAASPFTEIEEERRSRHLSFQEIEAKIRTMKEEINLFTEENTTTQRRLEEAKEKLLRIVNEGN